MSEDTKQNKIFFARVADEGIHYTNVEINFAGKVVEQMFVDENHAEEAAACVREWNAHFSAEWKRMCEVSTAAMCMFVKMLRANGVSENTITSSIRGARAYA